MKKSKGRKIEDFKSADLQGAGPRFSDPQVADLQGAGPRFSDPQVADLLVEIGVEELPHSFIAGGMEQLRRTFTDLLTEGRISFGEVREYSTPRRMALIVRGVSPFQEDYLVEKRGPSQQKAYLPDGKPSPALQGFLRASGAEIGQTVIRDSGNGKYVFLEMEVKGLATDSLLPGILEKTLASISFPKTMKWEPSGFTFARPIRWIVFLLGKKVIPFTIAGVSSSRSTQGHRTYFRDGISIASPDEYEKKLLEASVLADRNRRRESIKSRLDAITEEEGLEVPGVAGMLYDRNTDLVENPHAVLCSFDEPFLELPPEVLMSEMMEHQHYFPLLHRKNGKLSNRFVAISNITDNARTESGYQRVLRARLNDGKFFFTEDGKRKLGDYFSRLSSLTFHEKLGTMDEKVERIRKIGEELCAIVGLDEGTGERIDTVASLCKNDLVTLMVGEFPELQGIMGSYYALSSGYPEAVARGIREHYLPRFAGDSLPDGIEGIVVGIADRLDTIIGIFSIGLKPTGSKDPFGLRRRVLGIIRIVIARNLGFSLRELIERAARLYDGGEKGVPQGKPVKGSEAGRLAGPALVEEVSTFFKNRIRSIFEEMGFAYDEIDATMANVLEEVHDAYRRVEALHEMRGKEGFDNLLVSFKRMGNIIKDETEFFFSGAMLGEKAEKELYGHFTSVEGEVVESVKSKKYRQVYEILSGFKPYVDTFFDQVLVMDENIELRKNRMGLLKTILNLFADVIDFSRIVQPGE